MEAGELRMPDTKTGPRKVSLSPAAVRVVREIPRVEDSPWVIPGRVEGRPMRNIDEAWWAVCYMAGLKDIRIHDCRHSYATLRTKRYSLMTTMIVLLSDDDIERMLLAALRDPLMFFVKFII